MFVKISSLAALAMTVSLAAAFERCLSPPTRSGPGRDVSFGNYMCSDQISNCAALCGGNTLANECTSDNDGYDNPYQYITYCFDCQCADGSEPDLVQYLDTIPNEVCWRRQQNCQYGYNQVGQLSPPGACVQCGEKYAVEPSWMSMLSVLSTQQWSTSTTEAAATPTTESAAEQVTSTSSAAEVTTTSTSLMVSSTSTSSSTTVSTTSSTTSSSSEVSSVLTSMTTSQSTSKHTSSTSTTKSSSRTSASSTTSAAAVKTGGAALVEPAMAVVGMGFAVVMAL